MATKKRYDSGADSVLMNDEDYALTQKYKQDFASAQQAGNQAGMDAAHDAVEALRAKYNYSGGADGSDYISLGNKNHSSTATKPSRVESMEEFSYESAPTWTSKYQDQIDALTQEILNRPDFSYDPESDPRYQAFRKEYQREGQRATADTLGQMAVMTGGMPSTAAATAAQQAGDYYAAQMADRIPELYQLAYDMYRAEGDELRANLDMLDALESGDYNRYLNLLNQYNTDRNFAYGVYGDTWNRNYQLDRDDVDDTRYDMEWNYGVDRDEVSDQRYQDELAYSRNLDRAQTLAAAGDFSGYKALGYSDAEIRSMQDAYNREQAAARLSSSGSSRSGSAGGGEEPQEPRLTYAQTLQAIEDGRVTDAVRQAYDYYLGEGAYESWFKENLSDTAKGIINTYRHVNPGTTADVGEVFADKIDAARKSGSITEEEADYLLSMLGF